MARVYDPLGMVAPVTLVSKEIYREICDGKLSWDEELLPDHKKRWRKWMNNLTNEISITRSLVRKLEKIDAIDLHSFGDASNNGVSAVVHAVVHQETDVNQGFMAAKARLAKKSLTILRKELVAGHMSAYLVRNVKKALENLPIRKVYGWLDSTVALDWIKGNGEYKQFVYNRVRKMKEIDYIQWRYVPTDQNISDIGSRGAKPDYLNGEWKHGPKWPYNPELWPKDISTKPTEESEAEAKQIEEVMMLADQKEPDIWDNLMGNHQY